VVVKTKTLGTWHYDFAYCAVRKQQIHQSRCGTCWVVKSTSSWPAKVSVLKGGDNGRPPNGTIHKVGVKTVQ
jgi:hypothetical protein